jgi:uncharacterized phage infection (PIP) family protein YhgE
MLAELSNLIARLGGALKPDGPPRVPPLTLTRLIVTDLRLLDPEIRLTREYLAPFTVELRLESNELPDAIMRAIGAAKDNAVSQFQAVRSGYADSPASQRVKALDNGVQTARSALAAAQTRLDELRAKVQGVIESAKDPTAVEQKCVQAAGAVDVLTNRLQILERTLPEARKAAEDGLMATLQVRKAELIAEASAKRSALETELQGYLHEKLGELIVTRVICDILQPNMATATGRFTPDLAAPATPKKAAPSMAATTAPSFQPSKPAATIGEPERRLPYQPA